MRVIFAGTPPFAARALEALFAAGHDVALVLTQPDRPAGRGLRLTPSAVAEVAQRHQIPLFKPEKLKQPDVVARLREAQPDVMVVAAYGLILPPAILDIPARGCLNIHASLLPRWRGAAPIQRALQAGDTRTGVCIMQMDAGLDTGPVLLEEAVAIGPRETAGTLTEALAGLGSRAIVDALARLDALVPRAQDDSRATYAAKFSKAEARIDWTLTAPAIDRFVRAFTPSPGAETRLSGEAVKIWEAEPTTGAGRPGEVLEARGERLVIACGEGALAIQRMQKPGGKKVSAGEFLRGTPVTAGAILGPAPVSP